MNWDLASEKSLQEHKLGHKRGPASKLDSIYSDDGLPFFVLMGPVG